MIGALILSFNFPIYDVWSRITTGVPIIYQNYPARPTGKNCKLPHRQKLDDLKRVHYMKSFSPITSVV